MTFSLQENFERFSEVNHFEIDSPISKPAKTRDEKIHLFAEQLRVPANENYVSRPRLDELVQNSLNKIGALLITGRAGTGKTALTANFARNYRQAIWYRVEAADTDWKVFSSYLFEGVCKNTLQVFDENVSAFTEKLFGAAGLKDTNLPDLIVLDDIHNVFDAGWFNEFFTAALYSLPPETHLIFLSRSQPVCPLWRLRSKQILAVIDEKMLAFNPLESEDFCKQNGISVKISKKFFANSSGRIGKLKSLIECKLVCN